MPDLPASLFPLIKSVILLMSRLKLPKLDGEVRLPRLKKAVEIRRDKLGIPHIYAQSYDDLFFAQGFVHAQDRLFQLDFSRRIVAGQLSEILGEVSVPLDRWMRTLTMRRIAEAEIAFLDEDSKAILLAYANGINAFITSNRLPVEFLLFGYKPKPWEIADSLSWVKMMSLTLSVNWEAEILRAKLVDRLGAEKAAELEPPHLKRWPFIVPPGSDYSLLGDTATTRAEQAREFTGPAPGSGLGSNNWVLSGSRTSTGLPILANDMHLALNAPAIWYENHLVADDIDVTGVTFPSLPGVIAGHSQHVAWGFTNGYADVQDLYMERLQRLPEGKIQAEYLGEWEDIQVINEKILVKNSDPVVEDVLITRHGPIINDLAPDLCGEQPLALRWTSLEKDNIFKVLIEMMLAKDCREFQHALRHWTAPVQNVVYADNQGNIAYTFAGKIPIRARGNGRLPVPGWTDEYEWIGYIPYEQLPHLYNPPQGYIVTANNTTIDEDYPIDIALDAISGDRAQRISELIIEKAQQPGLEKIDIAYNKRMQFDQASASARVMQKYMAQLPLSTSAHYPETDLHQAVKIIKEWEGELNPKSPAAAIYEVFIRKLANLILVTNLGDEKGETQISHDPEQIPLSMRAMGKGPTPIIGENSLFGERWLPWLMSIMPEPDSHWFNLGHGEKRDDTMLLALQQAVDELYDLQGREMDKWQWGNIHKASFVHYLSSNPLMSMIFSRGPFAVGGDNTTLWATGASYHNLDCSFMVGPPFRIIVDLSNLDNSLGLLAPGQSGNPSSPHYDDQVQSWFKAGYHSMYYSSSQVNQYTVHLLKLIPR